MQYARSSWSRTLVYALACATLFVACGGDGDDDEPTPPTFTEIYDGILSVRCADAICHGSGGFGMNFTSRDAAYASLVGVTAQGPSCGTSGATRVVPGNPDASLMYQKLLPNVPCGSRMPGAPLDDADMERIADWIEAGAAND